MSRFAIALSMLLSNFCWTAISSAASPPPLDLHHFERAELTDTYFSEGAAVGDLNRDGSPDIVYGPYWFEGPDFKKQHAIYRPQAQPREAYANHFFCWTHDFNQDGWQDILTVGFPGTPAHIYENPGKNDPGAFWAKHEIFDWVSNESPQFADIDGDGNPDLICTRDGRFGYATYQPDKPFDLWSFHAISDDVAPKRFGHGLGIGDIDGDGKLDLITKDGWFEHSDSNQASVWDFHPYPFAPAGGADMFAYDVDGDGDQDVITSLDAHAYGLAWYEQVSTENGRTFRRHLIMGDKKSDSPYGILFTELHSLKLADINQDGLLDIVTGKTFWSHHTKSPLWDAGPVVYWFELRRTESNVEWVPHRADSEAGIGRQIVIADVNQDGIPDVVTGGMKGCHVLTHEVETVDADTWKAHQPNKTKPMADGLEPLAAAQHMTVPAGFHVQLAAGEPQIHQPIAMAYDHRGRLWVAEAHTYPRRAPDGQGKDKIIILEDTNLDGTLDSRQVFAEGLNLVSGLEVGFGGVWVGAAPYLMFIPDNDGDDVPDTDPQILLDGFGYQDTHETLNAFNWGPDGWLYGCHGVFTHSLVGKPGTSEEDRTPVNAAVWRYHPVKHEFEIFARGTSNPWGVDFNSRGDAFITACVIPHLYHVIQGARYQRQGGRHFNPHVYDDIKTIADHLHYAGNIGDHAWWGHEPTIQDDTSEAGGGHAHCGAMIYLGDNWPAEYRDRIYFNNVHGNRVNTDILEPRGSGYVGRHGEDLLKANDHWFRGINLRCGPDGTVHLIDWYDPNACHRTNPEIWDRTNGRVYRISYGNVSPVEVDLSKYTPLQLAELQSHPNAWYARKSREILQYRAALVKPNNESTKIASAREFLRNTAMTHADIAVRLRSLWTLHVTGGLPADLLRHCLRDGEVDERAWAIQLALESESLNQDILGELTLLASTDTSAKVRLYLASALQRLPLEDTWELAKDLLSNVDNADDHNLPLMLWFGFEPLVAADPERALKLTQDAKLQQIKDYTIRRLASDKATLGYAIREVENASSTDVQLRYLDSILRAFQGRVDIPMPAEWNSIYQSLIQSDNPSVRQKADELAIFFSDLRVLPRLRQMVVDSSIDLAKRQQALSILVRARDAESAATFQSLLTVEPLRSAAIKALGQIVDDPHTPTKLLEIYPSLSTTEKQDAINTLTSRTRYAFPLLEAISKGLVPRGDMHAYSIRQLASFNDPELTRTLESVWGVVRESSKDKTRRIEELKAAIAESPTHSGSAGYGRALFDKHCASCHRLFGEGGNVGPDLTGSNRANLDYILENVVDPNAVLAKDYCMSVFAMDDGRVISGLAEQESDSAITVRTVNDTIVLAKSELLERSISNLSLMPEGLLDQLSKSEIIDLITYLASPTQVTARGPSPMFTNEGVVDGAIEGEKLAIIGKSAGQVQSQAMGSFAADRWSGSSQLWWTGGKPNDSLEVTLPVEESGTYQLELVLTKAPDYATVQLSLDDNRLGDAVDLFDPQVVTTGVLRFDGLDLKAGEHRLRFSIAGKNPQAAGSYMLGIDYIKLNR